MKLALSDLRARVEAARGPDRELDAAIMFDLFAKPVGQKEDGGPSGYLWPEDNPSWSFGIRFPGKDRAWFAKIRSRRDHSETLLIERDGALVLINELRVPPLSASLDAVVALIERMLGWSWRVGNTPSGRGFANLGTSLNEHDGATPPLALLAALLAALEAKENHNARD